MITGSRRATSRGAAVSSSSREVWIDEIPAGDLMLEAAIQEGYEVGAIVCGEPGAEAAGIPLDDGVATLTYEEGSTVLCHVFMVPAGAMATPVASPVASPVA